MKWYTYTREPIEDIRAEILKRMDSDVSVLIGTDALKVGKQLYFVTAMVFRKEGKGGTILFSREKITRSHSLWEKLSTETWRSLEAAMLVSSVMPSIPIEVHVDASPVAINKSSDYVQQLVGMIVGQGFGCKIKPDSWVSTHCADHIVRQKHLPINLQKQKRKRKAKKR